MKDSDVFAGLFLVLFSLIGFIWAAQLPHTEATGVSAAFFPNILFIVLLFCGCGLIYQGWRREYKRPFPTFHWRELLPIVAVLLAYGFLLEYLGFIIVTLCFMVISMWLFGERKPILLIAVPLLSTFGVYYLFSKVFMIVFP